MRQAVKTPTELSMTGIPIEIHLPAATDSWRLTASSPDRGEIASITSIWTPPDAEPAPPREWRHAGREESPLELAGVAGRVVADRFEASRVRAPAGGVAGA